MAPKIKAGPPNRNNIKRPPIPKRILRVCASFFVEYEVETTTLAPARLSKTPELFAKGLKTEPSVGRTVGGNCPGWILTLEAGTMEVAIFAWS